MHHIFVYLLVAALPATAAFNCVPDIPPVAARISIGAADEASGKSMVTGSPGAVLPGSTVILVTLETGNTAFATAGDDGSFSTSLFAPRGTTVMVKAAPLRRGWMPDAPLSCLPGTFVTAGPPPSGLAVYGAGMVLPYPSLTMWTFDGAIDANKYLPGGKLRLTGTLRIASGTLKNAGKMTVQAGIALERLSGPDGAGALGHNIYASMFLTPTGFPIERWPFSKVDSGDIPITRRDESHATASIDLSYNLPASLLPGYYRPYVAFMNFNGVPTVPARDLPLGLFGQQATDDSGVLQTNPADRLGPQPSAVLLPMIRIGDPAPPKLFWTLLTDDFSNGTRGVGAVEDRALFSTSSRILTQSDTFIIPRDDPDTGAPIRYRLEPFALGVSVADSQNVPSIPMIPFRFPSGSLKVTIQAPDGSVTSIGPAPFIQGRHRGVTTPSGQNVDPHGGEIQNPYQLSTMDPDFEVTFSQDGRHIIKVEGIIEDIWGNTWSGGGTYEVYIARPLSLDTAVLPGTPFVVGDTFAPGVIVSPPGPASVSVKWQLLPNSDPARKIQKEITGQANAFGYFQPQAGVAITQPGEYRVDITASFTDKNGNLWMGSRTSGSVVAPPNPPIVAHGLRGTDAMGMDATQWFFRSQTGIPSNGPDHIHYPFHSGDIVWAQMDDSVTPTVTFQDLKGLIPSLGPRWPMDGGSLQDVSLGQAPLSLSRPDNLDPHLNPSKVDLWAYAYSSVQLPLVRVREQIIGGNSAHPYWRFMQVLNAGQLGADAGGDMPNQFKFQYGGVVIRGSAVPSPVYDIYGSLLMLVPNDDPFGGSRVFPPFQGNGGGPSGGPLLVFNGKNIDMFFHLTGIRPGSVLEAGDRFVLAGAVAPTLPATISYTVTSADGQTIASSGKANKVGYYYCPENDFIVSTPGMYTVDLQVMYDGRSSAGQVTRPYPTGNILGTDNGRFHFYVTPRGAPPLATDVSPSAALSTRPLTIRAMAASGHVTAMVPGFPLESRAIAGDGATFLYTHDPRTFSRDIPLGPYIPGSNFNLVTISLFDPGTNSARVLAFQRLKLTTMEPPDTTADSVTYHRGQQ